MISIKDLKFHYNDHSFSMNIDKLSIEEGESVAVYGPSGSGKSTFLSLLSGELKSEGDISYKGQTYSQLSAANLKKLRLNNYGCIFQQPRLIEWMSVKDNILLPVKLSSLKAEAHDSLSRLSSELEVTELLNKDAGKLSLGEQMRVSIIRALIKKPCLILADEPTASLDSKLKEKAAELLINEAKRSNAALIMVSHDESLLKKLDKTLSSETWVLK